MFETELKFRIPPAQQGAVLRAVATASARRVRLQAVYFDTPDFALARARMALRLRKEGRVWVQTLKASGGLMARLEHEVTLSASTREPALDVSRHDGTPAGEALRAVLADALPLGALYRTDVQRTLRLVRVAGGTVEIACDHGHFIAGEGDAQRRAPIDEIEFELKSGTPAALVALSARWARRFGLWWDLRSKAEMGLRLATRTTQVPPTRARPPGWKADATPAQVFAGALQDTLAQALANAGEIADGAATPEHLHQLRVGLRRLRTALRVLSPWAADAEEAAALDAAWAAPLRQLGLARDADLLRETWGPRLQQAGAPAFAWPVPDTGEAPGALLRSPGFQALLMRTLALASKAPEPPGAAAAGLAEAGRAVLRPAWRAVREGVQHFAESDAEARHALRRRLKRLRYAGEFLAPAWPGKAAKRHGRALAAALEALGQLNDLETALAACRARTAEEPAAWFAVGWLTARREPAVSAAAVALAAMMEAPRPWRV